MVGCLFDDLHVVHVRFAHARRRDLDELRPGAHVFNGGAAAVAHAGAQTSDHLENDADHAAFVGHAPLDALGNELVGIVGWILKIAVGAADRYFQDPANNADKLVAEGIEGRVPYKGSVVSIIFQMVGGLRASMGYCGCATIEDMRTKTELVEITSAGMRESNVHDVQIVKEAPNHECEVPRRRCDPTLRPESRARLYDQGPIVPQPARAALSFVKARRCI